MPDARVSSMLIAGDLRLHELVVRHVVVERLDHPVAIEIRVGIGAVAAAHRIEAARIVFGVARDVEPAAAPRLAVPRRREQPIHDLREGVGRRVLLERVDLVGRRRQPGEIERRAADQRPPVGRLPTGCSPSRSSRARMNRSMSVFAQLGVARPRAAPACASGWNDQNARCSAVIAVGAAPRRRPACRGRVAAAGQGAPS